ncbi:MAG TPA: hypothetical protein VFI02_01970 [Armatimonadota bacterium]|nr:hypothetical protein [Armatimonadota bacterium]
MKHIIVLLLISIPAFGNVRVSEAYYRDTNNSLHLFLVNDGKEAVTVSPPIVNGFDTASLTRDELRPRDVLWYRSRPNPIPPGGIADLIIVLPKPPSKPVAVQVSTSAGQTITKQVSVGPEALRFQAIRFSPDLCNIDVYARTRNPIRRLRLDGKIVHASFNNADGLAFARISLRQPLEQGSYHVLEADSTAYQIRAIPAEFLIGVYGIPSAENAVDWAAHGINHYLSFTWLPAETLDLLAKSGISAGAKYIREPLVDRAAEKVSLFKEEAAKQSLADTRPSLLYHHLVDEPDVADYYAGRWLGASAMELVARGEFFEKSDPQRYTFIQLDNTFRPANYLVYGEAADVLATHRYGLGSYVSGEAGSTAVQRPAFLPDLLDCFTLFRRANEPKPFFGVTHFFNLGPARSGRPPTIGEMRLQCYGMIACGARGIIHYIHSGSGGGGEGAKSKPLWDAMTGLHAELKRVGEVVESGTPAPDDWVKTSSPHILAKTIVSNDAMAVVLLNLSHRSSLASFIGKPVGDTEVILRIPPWIKPPLEVVPVDGNAPVAAKITGGELHFPADEVVDTRCFLVTPR